MPLYRRSASAAATLLPLPPGPRGSGGGGGGAATRTFGTALGEHDYAVPSTAKWVDPRTGSNSNPGTLALPWATVEYAIGATPAGGFIACRGIPGGNAQNAVLYKEGRVRSTLSSGLAIQVARNGITIAAAPGEAAFFDGSDVITGFAADSGFWSRPQTLEEMFDWSPQDTKSFWGTSTYTTAISTGDWTPLDGDDPTVTGPSANDIFWRYISSNFPCAARPGRVWIDGVQQQPVASYAALGPGKFFQDPQALKLWLGSNPAGKIVEYTVRQKLFNFLGYDQTLLGMGIRRYAGSMPMGGVVQFHRSRFNLEATYSEDNSMSTFVLSGGGNAPPQAGQIKDNRGVRAGNFHWRGTNCDHLVVEGNDWVNGNDAGFNPAPAAGSWKVTRAQYLDIKANRHANLDDDPRAPGRKGHGKFGWFDVDVYKPFVYDNEFYFAGVRSMVWELCNGARCINNFDFFPGTESFVYADVGGESEIWNNTTVGAGRLRNQQETDNRLTYDNPAPIRVDLSGRQPRVRGVSPDYAFDTRYDGGWPSTQPAGTEPPIPLDPFPSSGWTQTSLRVKNNVVVGANMRAFIYETAATGGKAFAELGFDIDYNLYQPGDVQSTEKSNWGSDMTSKLFSIDTASGQVDYTTFPAWQTATGMDAHSKFYAASDPDVVDSAGVVIDTSLHAQAAPLPQEIADMIGVSAGVKWFGRIPSGGSGDSTPPGLTGIKAAVRGGTTASPKDVGVLGNSIAYGAGKPGVSGNSNPKRLHSFVGQFRELLSPTYGSAGTGWMLNSSKAWPLITDTSSTSYNVGFNDLVVPFGAVVNDQYGPFKHGDYSIPDSASSTTPTAGVDVFATGKAVRTMVNALTSGTSVQMVQVDSQAPLRLRNVQSGGPTPDIERKSGTHARHVVTEVPIPDDGQQHRVRIWANGGSVHLNATEVMVGQGTIRVSSIASSGESLLTFCGPGNTSETGAYGLPYIDTFAFDLLVIELGVNDYNAGRSLDAVQTDLVGLINRQKAAKGPDSVMLVFVPWTNTFPADGSAPSRADYLQRWKDIAVAQSVPLLDLSSLWGSTFAAGDALVPQRYVDHAIHPTDYGAGDMALALKNFLEL